MVLHFLLSDGVLGLLAFCLRAEPLDITEKTKGILMTIGLTVNFMEKMFKPIYYITAIKQNTTKKKKLLGTYQSQQL